MRRVSGDGSSPKASPHRLLGWAIHQRFVAPVEPFIDESGDEDERRMIAAYLKFGVITRASMGYSSCRVCGVDNGNLELSDGLFVWPQGLSHYVAEHSVRLPDRFVTYAIERIEMLEQADRDEDWWRSVG